MVTLPETNGSPKPKTGSRSHRGLTPHRSGYETVADFYEFEQGGEDSKAEPSRLRHTAQDTLNDRVYERLKDDSINSHKNGTFVLRFLLLVTDNATDALLLSQLTYWLDEKRRKRACPHKELPCAWTAVTSAQLAGQLCRTPNKIDHGLQRLKRKGFVCWKTRMFNGKLHRHLWICWDRIVESYHEKKETSMSQLNRMRPRHLLPIPFYHLADCVRPNG